jgi:hypothetical protein
MPIKKKPVVEPKKRGRQPLPAGEVREVLAVRLAPATVALLEKRIAELTQESDGAGTFTKARLLDLAVKIAVERKWKA